MAVKKLNPVTPGQRFKIASQYGEVTKSTPEKSLTKGKGKSGGAE